MKKCLILTVALFLSFIALVGATKPVQTSGPDDTEESAHVSAYVVYQYSRAAVQIFRMALAKDSTDGILTRVEVENYLTGQLKLTKERRDETMLDLDGREITFKYGKDYSFEHKDDVIEFRISFDNYASYLHFNGLPVLAERYMETTLFFREFHIVRQNPFLRFNASAINPSRVTIEYLLEKVKEGGEENPRLALGHIHQTTSRATSTSSTVAPMRSTNGWHYFFHISGMNDDTLITIMERGPNPPIWYVIGVLITIIFMVLFYFIVKKRKVCDKI